MASLPSQTQGNSALPTTLLTPRDRLPRRPLGTWTEEVEREFDAAWHRRDVAACAVAFNQAALISAHRGDLPLARKLCKAQLLWHSADADRSGRAALRMMAAQPLLNLARLDLIAGDFANGERRLSSLRNLVQHGPAKSRPLPSEFGVFPGRAITLTDEAGLVVLARGVELELTKLWLRMGRYEAVISQTTHALDSADYGPGFREEARLVALAGLGRLDAAEALCRAQLAAADDHELLVFLIRRSEINVLLNAASDAARASALLAARLAELMATRGLQPATIAAMRRLATLLANAGQSRPVVFLLKLALDWARANDDEADEIELLRALSGFDHDPGRRGGFAAHAARKLETSGYAVLRHATQGGTAVKPQPFQSLLDVGGEPPAVTSLP